MLLAKSRITYLCFVLAQMMIIMAYAEPISMYTFYTPSHKVFVEEWFIPTLEEINDEGITLVIKEYPQECASGKVFSSGWQDTMLRKVDIIRKAIKDNWGKVIIYSDIDVQFIRPFSKIALKALGDKDIVFQRDTPSGTVCAGFFVCRANERTLALWSGVRDYMISQKECSDQKTVNRLLRKGEDKDRNPYNVIWDYLSSDFFGGGTFTGTGWSPGKQLFIPSSIVLHHANWCSGNEKKIAQLEYVRKKVQTKRGQRSSKDKQ